MPLPVLVPAPAAARGPNGDIFELFFSTATYPFSSVSTFYPKGSFRKFERDLLKLGPCWTSAQSSVFGRVSSVLCSASSVL